LGNRSDTSRRGKSMIRNLLFAAIAMSLVAPVAADAASAKKKHRSHQYAHAGFDVPAQAPAGLRRRGPPWAMPNECFYDEGYGRWSPCGGRGR
jgi:hypothetical protein